MKILVSILCEDAFFLHELPTVTKKLHISISLEMEEMRFVQ
jgi:hypothetical protein